MNRRHFLAAMLAAASAPAFVRAGSLMRVNPRIVAPAAQVALLRELSLTIEPSGWYQLGALVLLEGEADWRRITKLTPPGPGGEIPMMTLEHYGQTILRCDNQRSALEISSPNSRETWRLSPC